MRRVERQARARLPGYAGSGQRAWQEHAASAVSEGGGRGDAQTDAARKSICENCKHTVRIEVINGEKVATDTELIRTVPLRGEKKPQWGRRLHAERCEKLKADTAREALKAEKLAWLREQKRSAKNAASKRARQRLGR